MCCESSDVVRFDLGPLFQGQTRIAKVKSAYNSLIIGPRVDLWPFPQGQQWFTEFGELSFRWIQICIGSPMRMSSYTLESFSV